MLTTMLLVSLVLGAIEGGEATEVILKDGTKLVGVVRGHDQIALVMIIPLGGSEGSIGGSVKRPVRWTEIETIDGYTIAEWLEEQASSGEEPASRPGERGGLLERFEEWMGSRSGVAVGEAVAAIALLALVPALLLHRAGRLMGMRDLEAVRSLGGGLLAFGAAWAALRVGPGWAFGVPWSAVGAAAVLIWLTMRPTLGRWIVLTALEMLALTGLIAGILYVSRFLP